MSNALERLAFWRRRKSRTVEQIVSRHGALRDFIYLDVALVSSYLEQLAGGIPQEAQVSHGYTAGGDAGVSMSLFHINVQGGGSWGYRENQTIYWDRYARLENVLRSAGKLVDTVEEGMAAASLKPHAIFLASGVASFEPDWSNWQSGISMAKLVIDKVRQLNALEAVEQAQPDSSGMVPMLYEPGGKPVVTVRKDVLSQVLPSNLPQEPPENIRRLFKPVGVKMVLEESTSDQRVTLEGIASLEHFTPHRVQRYLLGPLEEEVHALGLVTQREGTMAQFIPLAIFVKI